VDVLNLIRGVIRLWVELGEYKVRKHCYIPFLLPLPLSPQYQRKASYHDYSTCTRSQTRRDYSIYVHPSATCAFSAVYTSTSDCPSPSHARLQLEVWVESHELET